ncbi:alpha/beta hydrolase [Streptomyces sp. PmtG]
MPPKPRPARVEGPLPPVLVVNATHDTATPLAGARRMARSFPKATLFTMDVVGHWLYRRGATVAAMRVIDAYLNDPKSDPRSDPRNAPRSDPKNHPKT